MIYNHECEKSVYDYNYRRSLVQIIFGLFRFVIILLQYLVDFSFRV